MPGWVGLYRVTYFILEICSWKWMLGETNMEERGQICCLYSEVSEASMSEGHVFSALKKLMGIVAMDQQRKDEANSFLPWHKGGAQKKGPRNISEWKLKAKSLPPSAALQEEKPQLWLCKESHRPGPAKGVITKPPNSPCCKLSFPWEGPVYVVIPLSHGGDAGDPWEIQRLQRRGHCEAGTATVGMQAG